VKIYNFSILLLYFLILRLCGAVGNVGMPLRSVTYRGDVQQRLTLWVTLFLSLGTSCSLSPFSLLALFLSRAQIGNITKSQMKIVSI